MNVIILLLSVVVVNSKWNDTWIILYPDEEHSNCTLEVSTSTPDRGILTIPESPITNLNSLLATLSHDYNPDDVNVVCSKGNCEDIISVLEDKIKIKSSNLAIDFEDDQTDKEIVVDFLYKVNSYDSCIPDVDNSFPCKVSNIFHALVISFLPEINHKN